MTSRLALREIEKKAWFRTFEHGMLDIGIGDHFVIFIGLIWGGALAGTGWLVNFPRLYIYGASISGSLFITDSVKGYHLGVSLTIVGGLILLTGITLLIRFIRRYPKQEPMIAEPADE